MEKYRLIKEIGDGTCGIVFKALNLQTNDVVAIKKMKRKYFFWEQCMNLREVKALRRLDHRNIVKLKEIVRENNELFIIFEYMECNLYEIMRERVATFSEDEIRSLMSQMLQGLSYMHKNGFFHRDLKPENLLVTNDIIKIADFGLVRETMSKPPYTDYVSTRWYRAPEVLLQSSSYTPAIDMWAVGAILAELFTLSPLFPGESETDQLHKICTVLGTPDCSIWPEGMNLLRANHFKFFQFPPANISHIIPNASSEAIDLILQLCSWDPLKRPTAEQSLQHPFFHIRSWIPYPLQDQYYPRISQPVSGASPKLELNLWDFGTESDDSFLGLTLAVKPSVSDLDSNNHVSGQSQEELLFCSGFQGQCAQSLFWPLVPSDHNVMNNAQVNPPISSPYLVNSQAIQPSMGVPESSGYSFPQLQPKIFEFGQFMNISSSPLQQRSFFD
ncbi:hypothetical protein J5N97_022043 [Dioscorea zingiberensis]|uniref:cyclin-dependent kinase n=1 Tax=Dioscorea zingiberensis TaxID=325984 RepID=A0A9D5HA71_9LILI|nr:hypothetical protein J5N97_022043 [Dioscorea zingiberensis]